MTATDGASVCVRVCAMFHVNLGNRNEHIISRGAIDGLLLRGQDINPTLPRDFENNRAATVHTITTAAVPQQYNSTRITYSGLRDSHGAFVFVCVCSVHQEIHAIISYFQYSQ